MCGLGTAAECATIFPVAELLILHNTSSRRGRRVAALVRELLPELAGGQTVEWAALAELGKAAPPARRLVAVGGDGTVNAAATWLQERGLNVPLAVVPAGTGNNLARGLGIALKTPDACRVALRSQRLRSVDAVLYRARGESGARLMVQTAALGFPADIAGLYDRLRRHAILRFLFRPLGTQVYRLLAIPGLVYQKYLERRGKGLLEVRCRLPDEMLEETVFAVFLGNERSLGGNFDTCPRAQLDDGLLDICMVRAGTGERYLRVFRRAARGTHLELERTVLYRQSPGPVEIRLSEPRPMLVDGDLWVRSDEYRLEVLPRRFQVTVGES
jgi:diacylglycerol kinase (ATP)